MSDDPKPRVPYWHLYVDPEGHSRQTQCHMAEFELASIAPPASPQWQGQKIHDSTTVMVTVLPVGWSGDWHENPKPQWIVPLTGTWFVESMDGQRIEMGPGVISFGEDQGCTEKNGRKGHFSGTVGNEPAVLMIVQFDGHWTPASPCRFK